tara:strand:- start:37 stop:339 length:303 start_codon:yes stop_codon:yes gene_type:complete
LLAVAEVVDIMLVPLKVQEAVVAVVVDQEIMLIVLQFLVVLMDGQQHILELEEQAPILVVTLVKALVVAEAAQAAHLVEQVVMVDLELLYSNMKLLLKNT